MAANLTQISRRLNLRNPTTHKGPPYIGVHARLGKGVNESQTRFGAIAQNLPAAARCLAVRATRLSLLAGEPCLPVFLATDTPEFRGVFEEVVTEMSHGRVRVVAGDWGVVHSSRLSRKDEEAEDLARKVTWGTWLDLMMLGGARHVVALYSSFPRLALHLGGGESLVELRNEICLETERW